MSMIVRPEHDTFAVIGPAAELASKIARTEFVSTALRNRPEAVLACFLAGREIGLPPMQSLALIDIIDGRPALRAQAARALVLSVGHEIWIEESTNTRCIMHARRRGQEQLHTASWTLDDAKRAGLANKQNWTRYPRNMLVARCTGDIARFAFADVLGGMPYLAEELEDGPMADEPAQASGGRRDDGAQAAPRRRARRSPGPAANGSGVAAGSPPTAAPPEPALELPGTDSEQPSGASEAEAVDANMTLAQRIAMNCREAGVERTDLIHAVTGKDRGRDLTREEAGIVLDVARALVRKEKALVEIDGNWTVLDVERDEADAPNQLPLGENADG
jgi:hypothetical protein